MGITGNSHIQGGPATTLSITLTLLLTLTLTLCVEAFIRCDAKTAESPVVLTKSGLTNYHIGYHI